MADEQSHSRFEQIRQGRIDKAQRLTEAAISPYKSVRLPERQLAADLHARYGEVTGEGLEESPVPCTVAGRIVSLRPQGKAGFLHVTDVSGKRIQGYVVRADLSEAEQTTWRALDLGDIVQLSGHLMRTRTGELTVKVEGLALLTKSLRPLPDKWHGLQDRAERYRSRHLDLIANQESREVFIKRSRIISALRRVLDEQDFLEVETPVLVPLAGGAAARPFMTHHNALDRDLALRIATELHLKRLVVGGLERVYEIGRVFRNEGLSTRHNPEFTSLEVYQAYANYEDMMTLTEALVRAAAQAVDNHEYDEPFARITMIEAVRKATGLDFSLYGSDDEAVAAVKAAGFSVEGTCWGSLLAELFEEHAEEALQKPTFVLGHPVATSPLAARDPRDPRLTERFELYAHGREIANAFTELTDPLDQRSRFEAQLAARAAGDLEAHPMDEDFLIALETGLPPTGGLGIGIDRLVMMLTGAQAIRDVILFPILREEE